MRKTYILLLSFTLAIFSLNAQKKAEYRKNFIEGNLLMLENNYPLALNSFKNAYAINPTKELLTKVLTDKEIMEKIKVIVERKDVTYNLDIKSLSLL